MKSNLRKYFKSREKYEYEKKFDSNKMQDIFEARKHGERWDLCTREIREKFAANVSCKCAMQNCEQYKYISYGGKGEKKKDTVLGWLVFGGIHTRQSCRYSSKQLK